MGIYNSRFWRDTWIGDSSLFTSFPEFKKNRVEDYLGRKEMICYGGEICLTRAFFK